MIQHEDHANIQMKIMYEENLYAPLNYYDSIVMIFGVVKKYMRREE